MASLKDILLASTNFDLEENKLKFMNSFFQLYQLEILHPSLNLIMTRINEGDAEFIIAVSKVWNRVAGHCYAKSIFKKIREVIFHKKKYCITIKTITPDIVIHEMAHAVEKNMELDLNDEFRMVLGMDMRNAKPSNLNVANAVNSVMKDELKGYELTNVMEELFARYFELLAMSYECGGYGRYHFHYNDITKYLAKTTEWVTNVLNPKIESKIDPVIKKVADEFISTLQPYEKKWSEEHARSIHSKTQREGASGKWSGITKSNADWQKSYQDYSDTKNKKVEE